MPHDCDHIESLEAIYDKFGEIVDTEKRLEYYHKQGMCASMSTFQNHFGGIHNAANKLRKKLGLPVVHYPEAQKREAKQLQKALFF